MSRVRTLVALLLALPTLAVLGCGSDDDAGRPDDGVVGSRTLTAFVSAPQQGEMRQEARDAIDAMKLALAQAGGRAGAFTVNLVVLDDSTPKAGGWDRDTTIDNAAEAARDRRTIAVIGGFDSDATALTVPILNQAEVLQISPQSSYIGLTRTGGVAKGEPEKYYPSGRRTFGRVVPADDLQAAAIVGEMERANIRSVHLANDRSLYGKGLSSQVRLAAEAAGIEVLAEDSLQPGADDYRSLAESVRSSRAGAFFFGGTVRGGAVQVFRDVAALQPDLPLYGGDTLMARTFVGRIGGQAARRLQITSPAVAPAEYPEAGRRFFTRFAEQFGRTPTPMAIYSYDAMGVLLSSIRAAGADGNDRDAVTNAFLALRDRSSPLGPFTIDGFGDTSRRGFGVWRVRDAELAFVRAVEAPARG